ncbi:MAG: IS5 family transposase [Sphingomonadaceae bacterium]|nr:IS5 family transposase [Sphingomonadaceae bacterium]
MMKQAGLFGLSDHLKRLSANGDPLEELGRIVDFEGFRVILDNALAYSDGSKGGRPPPGQHETKRSGEYSNVITGAVYSAIDNRLSWLRFLGFDLGAPTPDANTIRLFREKLTDAGTLQVLFDAFDHRLRTNGYLAMGGQIVDATLIAAPKQRNTQDERDAIKVGKTAQEVWPDQPAKAAQKDTDARWTVKFAKARMAANGKPQIDIAIPSFGYKNHIAIDQRFGFIRKAVVTHGARHDGSQLREVVTTNNTASDVWGDTAYQSKTNEAWLAAHGRVSRIHRKKPKGKPRSEALRAANRTKSKIRARVEHVPSTLLRAGFAQQKAHMGLYIRTIGIKRAETKIMLANLAYNMQRLLFHERRAATG